MRQTITLTLDKMKQDVEIIQDESKIILSAGDATITLWLSRKDGLCWLTVWDCEEQKDLFKTVILTTMDLPSYLTDLDK